MRHNRGEIYSLIARLFHTGFKGYIVVIERGRVSGTRLIGFNEVSRVTRGFIELKDGTVIPLHRVIGVLDEEKQPVWRRWREAKSYSDEDSSPGPSAP